MKTTTKQEAIEKFVEEFKSEYGGLAKQADIQVEQTATAGWQAMCSTFRESQRKIHLDISDQLKEAAKLIVDRGSDDGLVKSIGELKKQAEECYECMHYFNSSVLTPIREYAEKCESCYKKKIREADDLDSVQPLIWSGVGKAVRDHANTLDRYVWNSHKWRVERITAMEAARMEEEQKREVKPATPAFDSDFKEPEEPKKLKAKAKK